MSDRKIRHVEDIFAGRGVGDGKPSNILEKKSNFNNVYKKKKAPAPPSGQNALPKIGNYQPKIYMEPKPGSPEKETKAFVTPADVHQNSEGVIDGRSEVRNEMKSDFKPPEISKDTFIIGDKDIPLIIIEEKSDVQNKNNDNRNDGIQENGVVTGDEPTPVPMPRRKRRAPSAPNVNEEIVTNNPLFGRSLSQTSDTTRLDKDFEIQGGDIDFAYGIDNPGYEQRDYSSSKNDNAPMPSHKNGFQQSEDDLPYIPPPDYDDEELTMDFDEEQDFDVDRMRLNRNNQLYKDYEGEDFGKYLDEDLDYRIEKSRHSHVSGYGPPDVRAQKFLPRPPPKNSKESKKIKDYSDMKRNTIRDFTFTDSKIGWGDRTVKSTSAKGRYIKREKGRKRIDMTEAMNSHSNEPSPGSYEEFLRMKNNLNDVNESPNSSDSGVEVGDETHFMDMYLHSQPKQYKMAPKYAGGRKQSVWKKLTLRFKKSVNLSSSGSR